MKVCFDVLAGDAQAAKDQLLGELELCMLMKKRPYDDQTIYFGALTDIFI
jgi:hypothetical protein